MFDLILAVTATSGFENWATILPAASLAIGGFVVMLVGLFSRRSEDTDLALFYCALGGALISLITNINQLGKPVQLAFSDTIRADGFSGFLGIIIALATALSIMISYSYHKRLRANLGDYLTLILFSASGMMLLAYSNELVTIFVGVELMSIPIYILVGIERGNPRSTEASVKYLVLGAFASAFLLLGLVLLYGLFNVVAVEQGETPTTVLTSLQPLTAGVMQSNMPLAVLALGLIIIGFGFKVGAVPFHQWVPDVYEGAPTAVTAFMAVAVKAAGFGVFLRLMLVCFPAAPAPHEAPDLRGLNLDGQTIAQVQKQTPAEKSGLREKDVIVRVAGQPVQSAEHLTALIAEQPPTKSVALTINREGTRQEVTLSQRLSLGPFAGVILWIFTAATIILGNLLAMSQENIKRMLAYSSISHTGYLLLGMMAVTRLGMGSGWELLFYLLAYLFMTLGAFAVVILAGRDDNDYEMIDQLQGLAIRRPFMGLAMMVSMLSLAGIPLTAGFFGKLWIFYSAIHADLIVLSVLAILGSLLGVYYYLRVVYVIYMKPPIAETEFEPNPERWSISFAVLLCTLGTIIVGLFPWPFINWAKQAAISLFS